MVRRASQRGHTFMEVVVCLAVVTILVGAALGGEEANRQTIASAFDRLEARLAASSRLETLRAGAPIAPGRRALGVAVDGARGEERVTLVEPGLYEVRVVVTSADGRRLADLTTRVARGSEP